MTIGYLDPWGVVSIVVPFSGLAKLVAFGSYNVTAKNRSNATVGVQG